jgi:hypothetical protein
MAISRILSVTEATAMIIYLDPFAGIARGACALRGATIPEDQRTGGPPSVLSCTAWGFSCLTDCSASGELLPRLFTLTCASLPKNRRCLFCDTFRQPRLTSRPPACFTRHAAVWCSDFPLARIAAHQRSSAIASNLPQIQSGKRRMNLEARKPGGKTAEQRFQKHSWIPGFQIRLSFDHRFSDSIVDLPRST